MAEAIDYLLADVEMYGNNVKSLKWTPGLQHFPQLQAVLSPLQDATHVGSEMLASRMIDLGGHPQPASQAVMASHLTSAAPISSFSDATRQVIHDSQLLLEAIRDTFEVATDYDDKPTMQLLMQAAHYIQNTIWTFTALRSAQMN
ncbi:MAG: ferritin-like domain-containing protein [Bacteroidia bacterium]